MKITLTIPGLPKMANGGHGSWQRNAREKKTWKIKVAREMVGLAPSVPFKKIKATFTRCSTTEPDYDGLVHGFKPVRDALVTYGFIPDDKNQYIDAVYQWEKAPPKKGHIKLEIEVVTP